MPTSRDGERDNREVRQKDENAIAAKCGSCIFLSGRIWLRDLLLISAQGRLTSRKDNDDCAVLRGKAERREGEIPLTAFVLRIK
jgi:hypothetical protein